MKKGCRNRLGLSFLFVFAVFVTTLITSFIVGGIGFIIMHFGMVGRLGGSNQFVMILSVLFASIVVGTLVSPLMGRVVLKPIRKVIAAINQLSSGDFTIRLPNVNPPEFRALANSFNRMAEELGGIEVLRTDFVNNFSHEFKTPIVSIKGFAEMLKYDDLTQAERDEYLNIMISESSRLSTLATNVLNLSKLENQTILSEKYEFNLGEQIRQCILMLESKWEQKKLSLSVDIQDIYYTGNEELLNQVWLNLLDNALKFTPEGERISIALGLENERAKFVLRDNGTGISADSITHIFEKFYQADTSHTTSGNGLGLTIVKKIIDLHGGSIECKSKIGEGSQFTVLLPLK